MSKPRYLMYRLFLVAEDYILNLHFSNFMSLKIEIEFSTFVLF